MRFVYSRSKNYLSLKKYILIIYPVSCVNRKDMDDDDKLIMSEN